MLRFVLIAAILLVLPAALPAERAHDLIQRHCQVWHGASDRVASCRIELAGWLRSYKRGLRPADWRFFQERGRVRPPPLVSGGSALA